MLKIVLLLGRYLLLALLYIFIYRLITMVSKEWRGLPRLKDTGVSGAAGVGGASSVAANIPFPAVSYPAGEGPPLAELVVLGSADPSLRIGAILPVGVEFSMGRGSDNSLIIRDSFTSQHHARLYQQKGQFWLMDLGSTNGTNVNGKKIDQPVTVTTGDEIRVGEAFLRFVRCSYEVE